MSRFQSPDQEESAMNSNPNLNPSSDHNDYGYEPNVQDLQDWANHLKAVEEERLRDPWHDDTAEFCRKEAKKGDPRLKWHKNYIENANSCRI
jgi:hypothetical protein